MSNIIFPAAVSMDLPNLNMEMMQEYSKLWSLEHTKMGKGHFEGSINMIHTPRLQFATAYYSQSFMSKGDFPEGCIVLIYATKEAVYNFQNQSISPNEIIILKKGDEIDILTSGAMATQTIVIEEELFYKAMYDFFGKIPQSYLANKRLTLHPDKIDLFHKTVSLWKNYLTHELPKLNVSADYMKIEANILQELFTCLMLNPSSKRKEKFNTKKIRDLLHEKITRNIDIAALANALNISESHLHYRFKADYGITPKKYLENLRLNAVHKELQLAYPNVVTIVEIAQKFNFFHMGHFSTAYKKLFAQTPSQTLHSKKS